MSGQSIDHLDEIDDLHTSLINLFDEVDHISSSFHDSYSTSLADNENTVLENTCVRSEERTEEKMETELSNVPSETLSSGRTDNNRKGAVALASGNQKQPGNISSTIESSRCNSSSLGSTVVKKRVLKKLNPQPSSVAGQIMQDVVGSRERKRQLSKPDGEMTPKRHKMSEQSTSFYVNRIISPITPLHKVTNTLLDDLNTPICQDNTLQQFSNFSSTPLCTVDFSKQRLVKKAIFRNTSGIYDNNNQTIIESQQEKAGTIEDVIAEINAFCAEGTNKEKQDKLFEGNQTIRAESNISQIDVNSIIQSNISTTPASNSVKSKVECDDKSEETIRLTTDGFNKTKTVHRLTEPSVGRFKGVDANVSSLSHVDSNCDELEVTADILGLDTYDDDEEEHAEEDKTIVGIEDTHVTVDKVNTAKEDKRRHIYGDEENIDINCNIKLKSVSVASTNQKGVEEKDKTLVGIEDTHLTIDEVNTVIGDERGYIHGNETVVMNDEISDRKVTSANKKNMGDKDKTLVGIEDANLTIDEVNTVIEDVRGHIYGNETVLMNDKSVSRKVLSVHQKNEDEKNKTLVGIEDTHLTIDEVNTVIEDEKGHVPDNETVGLNDRSNSANVSPMRLRNVGEKDKTSVGIEDTLLAIDEVNTVIEDERGHIYGNETGIDIISNIKLERESVDGLNDKISSENVAYMNQENRGAPSVVRPEMTPLRLSVKVEPKLEEEYVVKPVITSSNLDPVMVELTVDEEVTDKPVMTSSDLPPVMVELTHEEEHTGEPVLTSNLHPVTVEPTLQNQEQNYLGVYDVSNSRMQDANSLMLSVQERWKSIGTPCQDVNLTIASAFRQQRLETGLDPVPGTLEGEHLCCINLHDDKTDTDSRPAQYQSTEETLRQVHNHRAALMKAKVNVLNNHKAEMAARKENLQMRHCDQRRQLTYKQNLENQELRYSNCLPVVRQRARMQMLYEHEEQRRRLIQHHQQEISMLMSELGDTAEKEVANIVELTTPVNQLIQQLENPDSLSEVQDLGTKHGPMVTVNLMKGPTVASRGKHTSVTMCLPALVAQAVSREDDIYNHFYKY